MPRWGARKELPASRGQECCQTSCSAQHSLYLQELLPNLVWHYCQGWGTLSQGRDPRPWSQNDIDVNSSPPCSTTMSLGQIPYVSQLRFLVYEVETIKPTTQHAGECQVFEYRICTVLIRRRCSINIQVPVHFHGALLRCYNAVGGARG